jgi:predicted transcriptional regulator
MSDARIRPLGELEQAIMEQLWRRSPATVKDVVAELADRGPAYTTVMTTMDRLHKKGLLAREKAGHAFVYRPELDRATFERRLVASLLGDLPAASKEALLSGFLDAAGDDAETLEALERLIAERKRGEEGA